MIFLSASTASFINISRPLHTQRIPANVKDIIIGDINGDKSTELVISLTDRVVRTYKWVSCLGEETQSGRLISVNKWEFASQIGTVTLNHDTDGSPALLGTRKIYL